MSFNRKSLHKFVDRTTSVFTPAAVMAYLTYDENNQKQEARNYDVEVDKNEVKNKLRI